jgi:hypothetical protein
VLSLSGGHRGAGGISRGSVRTGLVGALLLLKPLADAFESAVPLLILAALHEKFLERVRHWRRRSTTLILWHLGFLSIRGTPVRRQWAGLMPSWGQRAGRMHST